MSTDPAWSIGSWLTVVERPAIVDEVLDREDQCAGIALLALVLNHEDPDIVLPRVKRAMASRSPQTRANALQSLGHHARLHGYVDAEAIDRLRQALRDRTVLGGFEIRGYAATAASDVGMFVKRGALPRWFRRRFSGPRRPVRGWLGRPSGMLRS